MKKSPQKSPAKITFPSEADKDAATLFEHIGRALTAWELTETAFAQMFGLLVAPRSKARMAFRAYGSIAAGRARSDMIAAAAEAAFGIDKENKTWKAIKAVLAKFAECGGRRNEIAHGVVVDTGEGFVLVPSLHAERKRDAILLYATYRYTSNEILEFGLRFDALRKEVMRLLPQIETEITSLP